MSDGIEILIGIFWFDGVYLFVYVFLFFGWIDFFYGIELSL